MGISKKGTGEGLSKACIGGFAAATARGSRGPRLAPAFARGLPVPHRPPARPPAPPPEYRRMGDFLISSILHGERAARFGSPQTCPPRTAAARRRPPPRPARDSYVDGGFRAQGAGAAGRREEAMLLQMPTCSSASDEARARAAGRGARLHGDLPGRGMRDARRRGRPRHRRGRCKSRGGAASRGFRSSVLSTLLQHGGRGGGRLAHARRAGGPDALQAAGAAGGGAHLSGELHCEAGSGGSGERCFPMLIADSNRRNRLRLFSRRGVDAARLSGAGRPAGGGSLWPGAGGAGGRERRGERERGEAAARVRCGRKRVAEQE